MSLKVLVPSLAAIVLLALVVPPMAATWEHRRRIALASSDAAAIAERLRTCARDPRMATGPGNLPATPAGHNTIQNVTVRDEVCGLTLHPDPWGNGYLIGPAWVLSAGANGIVETLFPPPPGVPAAGDDVLYGR
jgi:hypothetical protein